MTTFGLSLLALFLQAASPQGTAGTGTVQGTIVRAGSAEPLGDVRVTLVSGTLPPDLPPELQIQLRSQGGRTAISDNAGVFVLLDVPAGRYTLFVQREGFSGSAANTSVVNVVADKISVVNLSLIPGAVIRGRVQDSAGRFQSNVTVQALSISYVNGVPTLQPMVSKATDDRGEYRLFGVPPGEYYISAAPRAPIANTAAASGTVRNVRTFHPSATTTTNATRVLANSGEEITGIDIVMQSSLHVRVAGRVFSEAAPPPPNSEAPGVFAIISNTSNNSASVMLVPRNSSVAEDQGARLGATVLLSAAEFQIQNVVPGLYDLFALVNSARGPALGRTSVDVIDRDVANVTVVIREGIEVRGTVTVDGGTDGAQNLRIGLQPLDSLSRITGTLGSVEANAGTFSIPSVPDGLFRVIAFSAPSLYIEDVLQNGRSVYDSGLEIRSGTPPDSLNVVVRSGAGVVEGTVVDAAAKPLARATAALIPNTRRSNTALYRSTLSDTNGRFLLSGLAPGEYKLFAWPGMINGAHLNADFLSKYEEHGRAITITPGSRITADVSAFHGEGR
jgi:protocatechuate 3,4-dioxygenase beta subunit